MTENVRFNNYFRNFILCGEIDFHCFLCRESFLNIEAVDKHLKWENHRKLFKKQHYDGRYRRDFIYKVRDEFYCEPCNEVTTEPKIHRQCSTHIIAKKTPKRPKYETLEISMTRVPRVASVRLDNFIVSRAEWHGIKDNFCTICSIEIDETTVHTSQTSHMINLIKTTVVKSNGYYFKTLKDNKYVCLICVNVYDIDRMDSHIRYECSVVANYIRGYTGNLLRRVQRSVDDQLSLVTMLYIVSHQYYQFFDNRDTARCRTCNKSVNSDLPVLIKHKDKHDKERIADIRRKRSKRQKEPIDHGGRRHEVAKFGKQNYIKLNSTGSWGYCTLCHVTVSASMKQALSHVQGRRHTNFLEIKGLRNARKHDTPYCRKLKFTAYFKNMYQINDWTYIINDQLQIDFSSFMTLSTYGVKTDKYICFCCDEIINKCDDRAHCKTKKHANNMLSCHVMAEYDEKSHFIRMIRPNVYHCAMCDDILPFWETVRFHIAGLTHGTLRNINFVPPNEAVLMRQVQGQGMNKTSLKENLERLDLM